jgi:hypothetical protein
METFCADVATAATRSRNSKEMIHRPAGVAMITYTEAAPMTFLFS